jgi:hypothetical protein
MHAGHKVGAFDISGLDASHTDWRLFALDTTNCMKSGKIEMKMNMNPTVLGDCQMTFKRGVDARGLNGASHQFGRARMNAVSHQPHQRPHYPRAATISTLRLTVAPLRHSSQPLKCVEQTVPPVSDEYSSAGRDSLRPL